MLSNKQDNIVPYKKDSNTTNKEEGAMKEISSRKDNYGKWYLDVIAAAGLAENSPVRGCMVIKPHGYALWENIQKVLDGMFKETGVENAYFPLFIPRGFLEKEAEHVKGFAKECAVVTHHRLEQGPDGKLIPAGKLEEPLIVRPTSETIMYATYSKWINSYRDLPLLINQWANVVRWEMRTRLFLRTMEFLWQEGHTAHATKQGADERTKQMLDVYQSFVEEYLAIPVIPGEKTESERFAGAENTTCLEAMMQDGKALQAATSHMLGQNFAKSFDVKFLDEDNEEKFVWQTSWGMSTRIIGALIMVHSDDVGLVLPPKISPIQVVITTISSKDLDQKEQVSNKAKEIHQELVSHGVLVRIDDGDERPGSKFFKWERKGVPIRIELGVRDLKEKKVVLVRRDTGEKVSVGLSELTDKVQKLLVDIQANLYQRAFKFQADNTHQVDSWKEFTSFIPEVSSDFDEDDEKSEAIIGGFLLAHWCGSVECEANIKEKTKATIRCIPFGQKKESGKCVFCDSKSNGRVVFAKAY